MFSLTIMKRIVWILFLIGWTFMISGYVASYQQCPPCDVEYRYIQRSLLNKQLSEENNDAKDMYNNMKESYGRINL